MRWWPRAWMTLNPNHITYPTLISHVNRSVKEHLHDALHVDGVEAEDDDPGVVTAGRRAGLRTVALRRPPDAGIRVVVCTQLTA